MTPLPVDSTARLWVRKSGISGDHETMFRFSNDVSSTEAVAAVEPFLNAIAPLMWEGDSFVSARWAPDNGNISMPVAFDVIQGDNPGIPDEAQYPGFLSFVGRDVTGRRVKYTIQGMPFNPDDNYRIFASENADIASAIAALSFELGLVTINSQHPIFNPYANLGYNAYFQRKARRSS